MAYKYKKKVFIAFFIFTVISAIFSFLNIIGFSKIVSLLENKNVTFKAVIPYLVLLFTVEYLPPVVSYIKSHFNGILTRDVREELETQRYAKTASLDIATIEQPEFQDLLVKANRGVGSVGALIDFSFNIIRDFTSFIFASIILIKVLPVGFLIIFLSLIPAFLMEHFSSKKLYKLWEMQIVANRSISTKSNPFLSKIGLVEIKFYKAAKYLLNKITLLRERKNDEVDHFSLTRIPFYAGTVLLSELGSIIVIGAVIVQVIGGTVSIGVLTLIWGTISRFSTVTEQLFRSFGRLAEHQAHVLKLYSLLNMSEYIDSKKDGIIYNGTIPKIEFRNVSFSYPDTDVVVLKDLSFVIHPYEEMALVGLNGAGKTTLFRLITRVYDPTEGEILVNDVPLSEYNLESWRNNMSIMNQDYKVFEEETIKENIIFDSEEKSELLQKVVDESDTSTYLKNYEKGINQLIGKEFRGGVELSKGQNQKMVLARTLYRNTPLVVLDEPTAAVDALSEDHIFKALRNNHKDQTRIIISHKFSNVRDADKIILIEHGRIIEQGSHAELMKITDGKYKELFELQAEGYK